MTIDVEKLLNTPLFAIDQIAIFDDLLAFIEFSERNIEWQKKVELQQVEAEMKNINFDEPDRSSLYDHKRDGVLFRFEVALPMRVRYAALATLIASIEWSMAILRPSFHVSKNPPPGTSKVIYVLTIFAERCNLQINESIKQLEFLVWVRNSIMHNSGVLKGYKYEAYIRKHISAYKPNFVISNWHFIGDTVEIRPGVLEKLTDTWREIIRELYTIATKKKLLVFS